MPNLIGTGLNQAPTNSMLGGLAYQSPDYASIKNLDLRNIAEINAETADTAVDVFVYDTTKDSDGGAWRQRTSHTSWYNEPLNTPTRGSRREFPAVAVIVATSSKVTIYDGDDPDLPMWMVFTNAGQVVLNWATSSAGCLVSAIYSLNGILSIAKSVSGCLLFNFIKDDIKLAYITSPYSLTTGRLITDRNNANINGWTAAGDGYILANSLVNNVAMTVLPRAPIDPDTGLQVPTIAVGTNGGVSIIKDDGNVYDSSDTNSYGTMEFNGQRLISSRNTNQVRFFISQEMRAIREDGFSLYEAYTLDSAGYPRLLADSGYGLVSKHSDFAARGGSLGVTLWDWEPSNSNIFEDYQTESSIAYISTTYNTGWMVGDTKGAFLSDTDDTNVTGSELVTNGTFNTDTSNWTANGSTLPTLGVDSNRLKLTHNGANGGAYQNITTVVGETYTVSAVLTNGNASYVRLRVYGDGSTGDGFQGTNYIGDNISSTSATTDEITFVAEATTTRIYIEIVGTSAEYAFADNVVARIADPDRSVNNKGLQVFGTVTKSAVAPGAELVGYSGFNSNNYLRSPAQTNHPFSFGTGNFSLIFWAKITSTTPDRLWYSIGDYLSSSNSIRMIQLNSSGDGDTSYFYSGSDYVASTSEDGLWHQWCFMRNNGTIFLYKDSVLQGSTSSTTSITGPDTYGATIGTATQNGSPFPYGVDYMSLFRISATAPSPEQIKKIYDDEKILFQDNAACTLYGSSDAVTALAYDDSTSLLHVGTSSGRSDFTGLKRINHTTSAVSTAISAQDGLIAQQ